MRSQSRPSRHVQSRRTGFTLVELLVVIGIIAVLISILLPSLAKARAAALKVACASNMRTLGQLFQVYASDNSGQWPAANRNRFWWGGPLYNYGALWPQYISPNGNPPVSDPWDWKFSDCDNYVASPRTFVCPAQAQDPDVQRTYILIGADYDWFWGDGKKNMVYGQHRSWNQTMTVGNPSKFRSSETIMMGEMRVSGPELDTDSLAQDGGVLRRYHIGGNLATGPFNRLLEEFNMPFAHELQGANYLFCDGHVEYQISPVRYVPNLRATAFDNKNWGFPPATDAGIAYTRQFSVDKTLGGDSEAGYWYDLP